MPGSRSLDYLGKNLQITQPLYNPATAEQFLPGQKLVNVLESPALLKTGWAPRIGHITTSAATAKRRTNPLLAAAPSATAKRKNPFVIPQTPSANLFGINIPA